MPSFQTSRATFIEALDLTVAFLKLHTCLNGYVHASFFILQMSMSKSFCFFLAFWHVFSLFVWFWKAHTFADCFSAGDLSSVCLKTIISSEDWRRATHAASTELVHFAFFSQHSELLSNLHHWTRLKMRGRSTFWPLDTSQHWRPCCRSRPCFESSELR